MQFNQEIFQKDKSCNNPNALEVPEYFENNNMKAQLQDKDTTIRKLKEHIKSMRENDKEEKVKHDMDEIETIYILNWNIDQFDSIKRTRLSSKEHCDSLIAQLNSKSMENANLKGQIQEKVFVTTTLQNELRRLKGKNVLDNATTITNSTTIAPGMFKFDLDPSPPSEKLVAVTPMNKVKKVRFFEPLTSSSNIHKQVESSKTPYSNTHVLPSIGLNKSTSASRSEPTCNKKNDRISQTPSSNMKNKAEVQLSRANLSSNKKNRVKDPICDTNVKHTMLNANSEFICVKCKQCMFDANHDVCFLDFVNDVNVRSKSKSSKQSKQHNIWKPTDKVFTEIGYKWKPTGKLFTLVGNSCPLTRITSTKVVSLKETTPHSVETQKPKLKVYSRKPKQGKSVGSSKKSKIIESRIANNSKPNHSWGSNVTDVPSSSSLVNDKLSRLFSEGLGHNLFSVGQLCDSDLEVAFWKNTCFIQNLDGVDPLLGSRDTNLYTISLDDMLKTSLICLLSKALKTKSWLWHHRLSNLNFGTLNQLAKTGLARGIPKLKFKKDHMCLACALGKSKKSSHQPKAEDTNQEKLNLLHMDLCGPMRVESINGKKYILVIVDD
ncbi:retrovirus-related pol polyprotein from transposon TNT 1-94 [Tanacetum coccineum]